MFPNQIGFFLKKKLTVYVRMRVLLLKKIECLLKFNSTVTIVHGQADSDGSTSNILLYIMTCYFPNSYNDCDRHRDRDSML